MTEGLGARRADGLAREPAPSVERARAGGLTPLGDADAALRAFWATRKAGRGVDREAVAALARLALDGAAAPAGTRALFAGLVEPLCDTFDPIAAADCDRVLAQVIHLARHDPRCGALDRALAALGMEGEAALLAAAAAGASPEPVAEPKRLRRILVPSRVTLGADVAVTRIVVDRALAACPSAEVVVLGPPSAAVILRGRPRTRHAPLAYARGGLLADRLDAFGALHDAVRGLTAGLGPEEWLLLDPDSRLTQLGLLTPAPAGRHCRFPSRSLGAGGDAPLGALARGWAARVLGTGPDAGPNPGPDLDPRPDGGLAVDVGATAWARAARGALGAGPVVAVSLGTGGNPRKRVGASFERHLLAWLCASGHGVLLARGASPAEVAETRRLCAAIERDGVRVRHLPVDRFPSLGPPAEVATWEGDTDAFVAAIGAADAYVGYDSAGHHVAAALGVPLVSVFVEANGPRHGRRWTPHGPGPVRVVRLAPGPDPGTALAEVRAAFEALSPASGPSPGILSTEDRA